MWSLRRVCGFSIILECQASVGPVAAPSAPVRSMNLPLLALAIAAFGIGTTEFVILGLLPEVAGDLSVSIPAAGMLVSAYALGVAVGGPLLAVATARWPRKTTLTWLMVLFIIGNVGCALAPSYAWLMVARVVACSRCSPTSRPSCAT